MFSKGDNGKGMCFRLRIEEDGTERDESKRGESWV